MQSIENVWEVNSEYLLRVSPKRPRIADRQSTESERANTQGWVAIRVVDKTTDKVDIVTERFGIVGHTDFQNDWGPERYAIASIPEQFGSGTIQQQGDQWFLTLDFEAIVEYTRLLLDKPIKIGDEDARQNTLERFKGHLESTLTVITQSADVEAYKIDSGFLDLSLSEGSGSIANFTIDLSGDDIVRHQLQEWSPNFPPRKSQVIRFTPVTFSDSSNATNADRAGKIDDLIKNAQQIWAQCCIELVINKTIDVVNGNLITEEPSDIDDFLTQVMTSTSIPDANSIPVYFVAADLDAMGGGWTKWGCRIRPIVVTYNFGANPHVLAHEIGHIYGGKHPNSSTDSCEPWLGENDTIMEATELATPNPIAMSHTIRSSAYSPYSFEVTEKGCKQFDL